MPLLAMRGRVEVIGSRGTAKINPHDAMDRDAAILTMSLFNVTESLLAGIHAALVAASVRHARPRCRPGVAARRSPAGASGRAGAGRPTVRSF
jgi:hypothetical protein